MAGVRARGRVGTVAVVDRDGDGAHVWWVNLGQRPQPDLSRLCGAWTFADPTRGVLDTLTFGRMVLPTKSGAMMLTTLDLATPRLLDVPATCAAVEAELDRIREAFDSEQVKRTPSKRLTPVTWPKAPAPADVEAPPPPHVPGVGVGRALWMAHWLDDLCGMWERVEDIRLARSVLRGLGGSEARDLPVVMRDRLPG